MNNGKHITRLLEDLLTAKDLNDVVLKSYKEENKDVIFTENGKVGLKTTTGDILIPAEYDDIPEVYDRTDQRFGMPPVCCPVVKDGRYGLYMICSSKHDGGLLTKTWYDKVYGYFSLWVPYYVCVKDGKLGLLDTIMGREVIPCEMDEIYESLDFDGCVVFRKGDKYGLMYGNTSTHPIYDDIILWSEEYVKVLRDDKLYWIDENGRETENELEAFFGSWYDSTK